MSTRSKVESRYQYSEIPVHPSDVEVGRKLGLDPTLDLATSCAKFYALERIANSLWEEVRYDYEHKRWHRLPKNFGSDSRVELKAYEAAKWFDSLTLRLADQFWRYVSAACGGELRHARVGPNMGSYEACQHWCNDDCCEHDDGDCTHECVEDCNPTCACGLQCGECGEECPCPCDVTDCQHTCDEDCGAFYSHCGHECDEDCEPEAALAYCDLPGQLAELFEEHSGYRQSRAMAWEVWQAFMDKHGPDALYWAAELFESDAFSGSYGGKPWALAARITADFLHGKMQPRTFVDRCWALQHNACSLFNKFYRLYTRFDSSGRQVQRRIGFGMSTNLDTVLEVQYEGDYDALVSWENNADLATLWRVTRKEVNA